MDVIVRPCIEHADARVRGADGGGDLPSILERAAIHLAARSAAEDRTRPPATCTGRIWRSWAALETTHRVSTLQPTRLPGCGKVELRVRQRPGPKNALGLIKFVFPEPRGRLHARYTPAQALFAKSRRDFSHGCVRVADPVALAEWVLNDRPDWTGDRILAATMGTQTLHVRLPRPIQVILFYTTAAVMPEDGTIHFAEDIYRHDNRLDRALAMLRVVQ